MDKYRGLDADTLHDKLAVSTSFQERKSIRGALRELTGLKLEGDTAVTLSFGANTVKKLASQRSPRRTPSLNSPEWHAWQSPIERSPCSSPRSPKSPRILGNKTPVSSPRRPADFNVQVNGQDNGSCNGTLSTEEINRQRRFRTYLFAGTLTRPQHLNSEGTEERKIVTIKSPLKQPDNFDLQNFGKEPETLSQSRDKSVQNCRPATLELSLNHNGADHKKTKGRRIIARRHHVSPSSSLSPVSATVSRGRLLSNRGNDSIFSSLDSLLDSPRSNTSRTSAGFCRNSSDSNLSSKGGVPSFNDDESMKDSQEVFLSSLEMRESDSEEDLEPSVRKKKVLLSRKKRVEKTSGSGFQRCLKSPRDDSKKMHCRNVDSYLEDELPGKENGFLAPSDAVQRSRSYSHEDIKPLDVGPRSSLASEIRQNRRNNKDLVSSAAGSVTTKPPIDNSKRSKSPVPSRIYSREPTERRRSPRSSLVLDSKEQDSSYLEREKSLQEWRERRERRLRARQFSLENDSSQLYDLSPSSNSSQTLPSENGYQEALGKTLSPYQNSALEFHNLDETNLQEKNKTPPANELSFDGRSRRSRISDFSSSNRDQIRTLRRSQSEHGLSRVSVTPVEKRDIVSSRMEEKTEDLMVEKERLTDMKDGKSPPSTKKLIEKLIETEAALQEALRKCSNFSERRRIRAEVRQLREQRTVLEGSTESHPASVVQRSASISEGDVTPAVKPELPAHYSSGTTIEELRKQLSQTADYDEKRKIRLALRQLRQGQGRDGSSKPPAGLQRSQSCVDTSSRRTPRITSRAEIQPLLSGPGVVRSQSVTEQPIRYSVTDDKPIKLSVSSEDITSRPRTEHNESQSDDVNSETHITHSRPKIHDSTICDNETHSKGDNSHPVVNGHLALQEKETESQSCTQRNINSVIANKSVLQSVDQRLESVPRRRSSLDEIRKVLRGTDTEFSSNSSSTSNQAPEISSKVSSLKSPKDHSQTIISFRRSQNESLTTPDFSSPVKETSGTSQASDNRTVLKDDWSSNLAKRRLKENEKKRESNLTPTDEWLEQKKKSSPTPCEVTSLLSTMDIEAAFSEILDAVEKPVPSGEFSEPTTPDSVIAEEDISLDNSCKTDLEEENKDIPNKDKSENIPNGDVSVVQADENGIVKSEVAGVRSVLENDTKCENSVEITDVNETGEINEEKVDNEAESNPREEKENSAIIQSEPEDISGHGKEFRSCFTLDLSPVSDKNGAISVIHGDDGAVTVQEVKQVEEGDTVITEWKKLRRSHSKTEEREISTIIEKRITSPGGSSSVYEKDITKTKKKLTSRGSEYFQRNNYNIRRLRDKEGDEIIEQEVKTESDNVSVSKGKSWGDKTEAKVTLNKRDNQGSPAIKQDLIPPTILEGNTDVTSGPVRSKALTPVSRSSLSKTSSGYGSVSGSEDDDKEDVIETPLGRPSGCPEIVSTLKNVSTAEGNTAILECSIRSLPLPTITWYKGDNPISESRHCSMKFDGNSGLSRLTIEDAGIDDVGEYRCVFHNPFGEAETKASLEVKRDACGLPSFLSKLEDVTVSEGQSVVLECTVADTDSVSWYKDGIIQRNSADFKHTFDGTTAGLKIGEIFLDDEGMYSCALKNKYGETRSSCKICVTECVSEDLVVPMFLRSPESQIVDEDQSIIIEADIIGSPQPIVTWSHDGIPVEGKGYKMSYDSRVARLMVKCVTMKNAGKYECIGENSAGRVSADCQLVVQAKPKLPTIAKPLSDVTVESGKDAILECSIVGNPPPKVSWRKNGRIIAPMLDFKQTYVNNIARLEIGCVCSQDSGWYECVATCEEGEISTSCLLTVQEPPKAESKPEGREDSLVLTASVKKFPAGYTPKMDSEQIQTAKSQASKVMLVRQSSLRSLKRDKSDSQVKRSESVRTFPQRTLNDSKQKIEAPRDSLKEELVTKKTGSENVSIDTSADEKVSVNNKSENKEKHPVVIPSEDEPGKNIEPKSDSHKTSLSTPLQQRETVSMDVGEDGDKPVERDHNDNDINLTTNSAPVESTKKEVKVSSADKFVADDIKMVILEKPPDNQTKADVKPSRSRVLEDLQSMCSDLETKREEKSSRFRTGSDLRRSQSVKTPTGGKPEWLEFKLRKVDEGKSPVPDAEKRASSKPADKDTSSNTTASKDVSLSRSQSVKHVFEKKTDTSVNSSVNNVSVQLQSAKTPSTEKSSKSSNAIKLTPVSERAKIFQMNDVSSGSKSPTSVIAKALGNLSRTESMKTPAGMRSYGVQRSQSVKIRPTELQANGTVNEPTPTKPMGEKLGDSSITQKLQLWDSSKSTGKTMDYSRINDEEELHKLLNNSENFEERKKIRGRLREIRDQKEKEWELKRQQREKETEDLIRKKYETAEQEKQKKMQAFKEQASHHTESRHLEVAEKNLKDKMKLADIEKQKRLEAFDRMARHEDIHTASTVHTETSKDGKTVTVRKTETVTKVGGTGGTSYGKPAEVTAQQLAQQLISASVPGASGTLSVKTESWSSSDGITHKSEKTESWGAKASPMNAFKKMDAQNNPPGKTNFGGAAGGKAPIRSPSAIKNMLLEWTKAMTREYADKIEITNFSTSWNDGLAFCALIHHFYPDAFDFNKLESKNRRYNFNLAFDTAEKLADIAPLLDVEDMVRMKKPDWKCVFTYVQSFYRKLRDHENNKAM